LQSGIKQGATAESPLKGLGYAEFIAPEEGQLCVLKLAGLAHQALTEALEALQVIPSADLPLRKRRQTILPWALYYVLRIIIPTTMLG
jgi:hypothetical protein